MTSWCSTTDFGYATGTALDGTTTQAIIDGAEREIVEYLKPYNLSGDSTLKEASLHLSIARLYTRYDLVGQLTNATINGSLQYHETKAWALVDKFISTQDRTREVKRWVQI